MPRRRRPQDMQPGEEPRRHGGFQKGKSGNPGGIPKPVKQIRDRIAALTGDGQAILDFFFGVMANEGEDTKCRLIAAEWLGDHYFGKPKQTVQVDGPPTATPEQLALVAVLHLSPHERRSRIAELKAKATATVDAPALPNGHNDVDGDGTS